MEIFRTAAVPALRRSFVSIGNFDGVHRGHHQIISTLVNEAQRAGTKSVVFTFEPHPLALLAPDRLPPMLTSLVDKAAYLGEMGVDAVWAYPTSSQILSYTPVEFFNDILIGQLDLRGMVEGNNFCFGKARAGTIETLKQLCGENHVTLTVLPDECLAGGVISSSVIRSSITGGDIAAAVAALGHPYRLSGKVVTGAQRGSSIGFPTANLDEVETLLPPDGVYAGRCEIDGTKHAAAVHLGPNPSFSESARKLEVHLSRYRGDLYGRMISVDLLERIRGIIKFPNVAALTAQLRSDVAQADQLAAEWCNL